MIRDLVIDFMARKSSYKKTEFKRLVLEKLQGTQLQEISDKELTKLIQMYT